MDTISVGGLRERCVLGVHPHERRRRRTVTVDLELECDLRGAAESDDLSLAVSYGEVARAVRRVIAGSRFQLLEALAAAVAECCLGFDRVLAVTVRIGKPGALGRHGVPAVGLRRTRG